VRFDLDVPSWRFLRERPVRDVTVMQSFAFDDSNGVIYVAQVVQGGRQLADESEPVPGSQRAAHGDLCISRVGYDGRLLSWMYLRRFGHGVAIGVEPVGRDSYLWLETAPVLRRSDGVGYGTRVGRVRFVPEGVVTYPSAAVEEHEPVEHATEVSVSLDALNRTLLVRALVGGTHSYFLYGLDAFRARDYRPLHSRIETGISDVFQGHAHFFDQVYRLEGGSGGMTAAPTHVSCFDLPTGTVVQRSATGAARTLPFREPEGLAVQGGPPRLHMGFADGPVGARNISVYYKGLYGE
jgi:nitrite reductase/ring-hydroxylating ferredoxin subunit